MIGIPDKAEYNPYYHTYISLVVSQDVIPFLEKQREEFVGILEVLSIDQQNYSYEEGKWTIKELLRHIIDAERIFAYRAMSIARNDKSAFPGMDQNEYMSACDDRNNSFEALIKEFDLLRQGNIQMFTNLPVDSFEIMGVASDSEISVRALLYIIVGHLEHHKTIMNDRYLGHV